MSGLVIRISLRKLVEGVISNFDEEYLRSPRNEDMDYLRGVGEERGFPGMMGSIDCMDWEWVNCPTTWAGQYTGRSGKPTIILEVVASQDFGSGIDRAPNVNYVVNGHQRKTEYYLTDGIYPSWTAFVKSISQPPTRELKLFAKHQEADRKDVERAFGVLQARFTFIKQPCLLWERNVMRKIMMTCIIMHNMIVEDERENYLNHRDPTEFIQDRPPRENSQTGDGEDDHLKFSAESVYSLANYAQIRATSQ